MSNKKVHEEDTGFCRLCESEQELQVQGWAGTVGFSVSSSVSSFCATPCAPVLPLFSLWVRLQFWQASCTDSKTISMVQLTNRPRMCILVCHQSAVPKAVALRKHFKLVIGGKMRMLLDFLILTLYYHALILCEGTRRHIDPVLLCYGCSRTAWPLAGPCRKPEHQQRFWMGVFSLWVNSDRRGC